MEAFHLIPLGNGLVFTLAALCLKRATNDGVGPWRATFFANMTLAAMAIPLWFAGSGSLSWPELLVPFAISVIFFLGQLFNCLAIHKGDVSVVTPILGIKVIFVGGLVTLTLRESVSLEVWAAALLSVVAVFLLRGVGHAEKKRLLPSIILGLSSALCFAVFDVLIQRFGREIGFYELTSTMFGMVGVWSFALIPLFKSPMSAISKKTWSWLGLGSFFLAAQAMGMAFVLSVYGKATVVNILYSSRGVWSVLLVWFAGHWFSNQENAHGKEAMIRRLVGSIILLLAIVIALG